MVVNKRKWCLINSFLTRTHSIIISHDNGTIGGMGNRSSIATDYGQVGTPRWLHEDQSGRMKATISNSLGWPKRDEGCNIQSAQMAFEYS
jgi:hypothetical protein